MLATKALLSSQGRYKGALFDGATTSINLSSGGSTISTSTLVWSWWMRVDTVGATQALFSRSGSQGLQVRIDTTGDLEFNFTNAGGTKVVDRATSGTAFDDNTWHHILLQYSSVGPVFRLYIDDVSTGTSGTTNSDTISIPDLIIGTNPSSLFYAGSLAEVWIGTYTGLDISNSSDRQKFIVNSSIPANLGSDGSTPYSTQPPLYFSRLSASAPNTFATNKGSNGVYALTGTLTDPGARVKVGL